MLLLLFAFVSGLVTVLSPCILPVLPILLSAGTGGGRGRPLGIVAGFVAGFAFFTLALSALVRLLGIPADALRVAAILFIGAFGLLTLFPSLQARFEAAASSLVGRLGGNRAGGGGGSRGFWGGLPVGLSLGLLWTPCVGPIMASVISLALSGSVDGGAVAITLAYSLGTALPLLGLMAGGRGLLKKVPGLARRSVALQRGFGAVMLLMALALALQWDRRVQTALLAAFPAYGSELTAFEDNNLVQQALASRGESGAATAAKAATAAPGLAGQAAADRVFAGASELDSGGLRSDLGLAPTLTAAGPWFNTGGYSAPEGGAGASVAAAGGGAAAPGGGAAPSAPGGGAGASVAAAGGGAAAPGPSRPLVPADLRGKVVLVDFWTYSCINCIRTLPWLQAWQKAYGDQGLVILGIHSPEFAFERESPNVQRAVAELGVSWPVVMDNDFSAWRAWSNRYWPAHYLIDARGRVRAWHFGEGAYEETEAQIRSLLAEAGRLVGPASLPAAPSLRALTPETYLGYARARGFASAVPPRPDQATDYRPVRSPGVGEWNLEGSWTIASSYLQPEGRGSLSLGFDARDVYLVLEPGAGPAEVSLKVDGHPAADTEDVKGSSLLIGGSRAYHLLGSQAPGPHVLSLELRGEIRLFAFTFG